MDSFAFIIHPINPKRDVSRKFPLLGKYLSEGQINFFSRFFPPIYLSEITGIKSEATGKEIKGWLLACPFTPKTMLALPTKTVYKKIIQTGRLAEKLGAKTLGLGAFTSVVGDGGKTIADGLDIPVSNGDSYTIAVAIQAIEKAASEMNIPIKTASAAIVGANGAIGRVCAELMASRVAQLYLIGKDIAKLDDLAQTIKAKHANIKIHTSDQIATIRNAQLILTVTSSLHAVIHPEHLQSGSVICDVARPRDVSKQVAAERDDVLVIDGGMVQVPGAVAFNFDFGLPAGKAYACMAETMILALEGIFVDYSIGKEISLARVEEISSLALKHGFKLSGFRSFETEVSREQIELISKNNTTVQSYA